MPTIETTYLSAGANRQTSAAAWSARGVIFGADVNVALCQPHHTHAPSQIRHLLPGHSKTVKAVAWLPCHTTDTTAHFLSGGDDQQLRLWRVERGAEPAIACVQVLEAHRGPVNCIATGRSSPLVSAGASAQLFVFATGAADATVKLWTFDGHVIELLQTVELAPKFFPLALAIHVLPNEKQNYVLACAGTKNVVQIFVGNPTAATSKSPAFSLQATLSGHEDWVRSLDFTPESTKHGGDLLLASASQDKYVRLWRLRRDHAHGSSVNEGLEDTDVSEKRTGPNGASGLLASLLSPANKAHRLSIGATRYSLAFDSLVFGHDDWVYSVKWHLSDHGLHLLSTSADNTAAIWEMDRSGVWVTAVRLGDLSREKGATTATGSIGGFWTGLWSPDGSSIVTLGRTGSWRRWDKGETLYDWIPKRAVTGHTKAVTGIAWSKDGRYLLSASPDQTTRMHAQVDEIGSWCEVARPQIHGYDLNCVDSLGLSMFVSGADEKLMRVFSEPNWLSQASTQVNGHLERNQQTAAANGLGEADLATSATVDIPSTVDMPVLGLSNKINADADNAEATISISFPPLEDDLSRRTLWPEAEKLYGHGYEISCLATSHDGKFIASACKASSLNHAVVRLFETERWTEMKPPLQAHSLTVARLRFSADDKYLLSVGRDRQWTVFERSDGTDDEVIHYKLLQAFPAAHKRMINDAAWAQHDTRRVFATAGRDGSVKIWAAVTREKQLKFELVSTIQRKVPVMAVDFLWSKSANDAKQDLVLAIGTEDGDVTVGSLHASTLQALEKLSFALLAQPKPIIQLAWRPQQASSTPDTAELAVAGEDGSVRIHMFTGLHLATTP